MILDDALAQDPFSADEYICREARPVGPLPAPGEAVQADRGALPREQPGIARVHTRPDLGTGTAGVASRDLAGERPPVQRSSGTGGQDPPPGRTPNIIGIFIWDFQGRIIEANQAFLDIVGYAREDLVSGRLRWTELTPAEWRDADERAGATLKAAGTVQPREKEYFRKDGSRVPVLLGATTFGDEQDEGVAFVLDLTERKRVELERQLLASLVEQATEFMAIADISGGTPLYLNKAGLKMVGFDSLEEAKTRRGLHYMFPDDRPFVNTVLWPSVLEKGSWSGEMRLRHFKIGDPIPIHYSAFRIDDPKLVNL